MATSTQTRLAIHQSMADFLVSMAGAGLKKKQNESYIVLELKLGKSDSNKNAVSLLREGVSFMVPDFSAEQEAKPLGLNAEKSKSFPRLIFTGLKTADIEYHADFFTRLVRDAKLESERLQQYQSASSASDKQHSSQIVKAGTPAGYSSPCQT